MTYIGYYYRDCSQRYGALCVHNHISMLDLCKSVFVFLEMLYILIIYSYMFIFSFDCYIPLHKNPILCIIWYTYDQFFYSQVEGVPGSRTIIIIFFLYVFLLIIQY